MASQKTLSKLGVKWIIPSVIALISTATLNMTICLKVDFFHACASGSGLPSNVGTMIINGFEKELHRSAVCSLGRQILPRDITCIDRPHAMVGILDGNHVAQSSRKPSFFSMNFNSATGVDLNIYLSHVRTYF